ncbi:hypothetical protein BAUCODRAFT_569387 [Baudoinia panamericana UAMH 10762]|uniref:PHD-type domain-containing protein n=1 Tax=Baudoinia panamericana (strain UAMH 10762) TaxID=717646 RepID=M2M734_BAUPA|nr:uncharacterized protein BAUCODRAFT_569387 [Baudoinia panamericana UAMH 10762]EMC92106.1 hypothetical protein BAUCODRAFT_569387 [Baudoinia panamericana UAMH 10762]
MSSTRPGRGHRQHIGFVSTVDAVSVSDDDARSDDEIVVNTERGSKRKHTQADYEDDAEPEDDDDQLGIDEDSEEEGKSRRRGLRRSLRNGVAGAGRSLRSAKLPSDGSDEDEDGVYLQSDLPSARKGRSRRNRNSEVADFEDEGISYHRNKRQRVGERQSGRSTRHQGGMEEKGIDDIYRSDSNDARVPVKPKVTGAREAFKPLPRNDEFRMRHMQFCEVCNQGSNFAPLICCQGCTLAYHKSCLGHRTGREHLVTKIGDGDFVLQCRRCVAFPRKKDPTAPDQGKCSDCHEHGNACRPFRARKTPAQEQKERDENDGEDPIYKIHESRMNNLDNVLFRCIKCWRGFHFEHLPSRSEMIEIEEVDVEQRFREYSRDWECRECLLAPAKVGALVAWKPVDEDNYDPGKSVDQIDEDQKAYLVKWDGMSYFRSVWMPGAWVWGATNHSMRKAFAKREDSQHPKMRTEDAIPEDYLRTDIVLDIKFTSIVDIRTEEIDKARIKEIDKALIKYKGLTYEDAVWEKPPTPDDGDRWIDFVTAYNDWVAGRYVRLPTPGKLKKTLDKIRTQDFSKLEKQEQPANLTGGELMRYQVEGLNWLYFKWFSQKNAILADEMGLGKTIQIIGFLATLVQDHNCFPFLIVVPNSTCPNWRREIKNWAPSLRVVAYYGSKESRDLAYRYELFPEGSKDLRCHVVVTSYDAAADENCRKFFRGVAWQGLIVDEGQRLKNDKNLLYSALGNMKIPFRILLTGTPLQNNARELFNLLHFLDETYDAGQLEEEYAELDQDKITKLHDLIRPFFLRRTKAQVLSFLPPMAQIIVPVSMTIVQKKLYRTILAKNPELMKAIFASDGSSLKQGERGSLNNILMQLRKCLCHPFVYNKSIEECNVSYSASHRNLVDASSKLKLLEPLLPKLRERGHRVLIFSQFLDMLDIVEDFMDGLAMPYQRLDGKISALEKQKRIDGFNAPDSPLFAFLLSTRAGGVGINLATADTVIILDPDFNPHQDIQALSRAHRIGQCKKVLCFQLVTRASAEERIMQMGRKKLALDHVLIQEMDADDAEQNDLVSVLRHGAGELFEDSGEQDIVFDSMSVERLLDRSRMEDTQGAGPDKSAETAFSFARVWAHDSLQNDLMDGSAEQEHHAPDPGVWAKILKERERVAAEEAAAKAEAFGRGRRARAQVHYNGQNGVDGVEGLDATPMKSTKKVKNAGESDTDFQAEESGDEDFEGEDRLDPDDIDTIFGTKSDGVVAKRATDDRQKNGKKPAPFQESHTPRKDDAALSTANNKTGVKKAISTKPPKTPKTPKTTVKMHGFKLGTPTAIKPKTPASASMKKSAGGGERIAYTPSHRAEPPSFRRVTIPTPQPIPNGLNCLACKTYHSAGSCPLKLAGVEHCNLCGIAHFGHARVCPHIQSETQVRAMLEALRHSNEPEHLVNEAKRYLRGLKGNLVQLKKQIEAKKHAAREAEATAAFVAARAPVWQGTVSMGAY